MKGLDLSRLKKLHETAHAATLIHKDGHIITIAKGPLSEFDRKQIHGLEKHPSYAEGGEVDDDSESSDTSDDGLEEAVAKEQSGKDVSRDPALDNPLAPSHVNELIAPTDGLYVPNSPFQQGPGLPRYTGDSSNNSSGQIKTPWTNQSLPKDEKPVAKKASKSKPVDSKDSTDDGAPKNNPQLEASNRDNLRKIQDDAGSEDSVSSEPAPTPSPVASPTPSTPAPSDVPAPPPPPPPAPAANSPSTGFQQEQDANLEGAKAIGEQGDKEAAATDAYTQSVDEMPTQNDILKASAQKDDELRQAFQSKEIDPEKYWKTHSRAAGALGLIFSGIGHTLPTAMNYLGKVIDQDIEAQKSNKNQALSLWKMNREATGNNLAADLATKKQMLIGLQSDIAKFASQAKGPVAVANAHAANAQIQQKIDALNQVNALMGGPTSDVPTPESKVMALSRLGVIPPAHQTAIAQEIKNRRSTVTAWKDAQAAFNQAAQDVRSGWRAKIPGTYSNGQLALKNILGPQVQRKEGSAAQARFDQVFEAMIPGSTYLHSDDEDRIKSKGHSMADFFRSGTESPISKMYGVDLDQYPDTKASDIKYNHVGPPVKPPREKVVPLNHVTVRTPKGTEYFLPKGEPLPPKHTLVEKKGSK